MEFPEMADIVSSKQRSAVMAAVKSTNTRPELLVRSMLHRLGFRFRLHAKDLPGKPDICFHKIRKVIFVHGCFWHGHNCKQVRHPSTNVEYWEDKIAGNLRRDRRVKTALTKLEWKYLV